MRSDTAAIPCHLCPIRTLFVTAATILYFLAATPAASQSAASAVELQRLEQELTEGWEQRRAPLYFELLSSNDPALRRLNEHPDTQLMGIDPRGLPIYYITHNADAAATTRTSEIWPGGASGHDLSGAATHVSELAIWDAGKVRDSHQEFGGRIVAEFWNISSHATHVAGTMIAAGVDPQARGMSYEAPLQTFYWNNDSVEMTQQAAAGLLVSNHSYGIIGGWQEYSDGTWYWFGNVGDWEDMRFGYYDNTTAEWDAIAYAAPHYLIVKSAGNDRDDAGPGAGGEHYHFEDGNAVLATDNHLADGYPFGFDTISTPGCGKNTLTVGAVRDIPGGYTQPSDVVQTAFSSWGPADDGRIKPDLVACGDSLYSASSDSDTAYEWKSGTSMATPNVSGSVNLLKELYRQTYDATPRSSTLKAIVLHTADEAGAADGPDYANGWGLLNTRAAADLVVATPEDGAGIAQSELPDGGVHQYDLGLAAAGDVCVTIVWTDPPGTPPVAIVDPVAPMLVNDLDLRLEHVDSGTSYLPWRLDRTNPLGVAGRGDNAIDNVERIDVTDLPAGQYRVTVSHKNSLTDGQQVYSIVWSGFVPDGSVSAVDGGNVPGGVVVLAGVFPNPFNPRTRIRFEVPSPGRVQLAVYDLSGRVTRLLVDDYRTAGSYSANWNGRDDVGRKVASGTYLCRLTAAGESVVSKMVLVQ